MERVESGADGQRDELDGRPGHTGQRVEGRRVVVEVDRSAYVDGIEPGVVVECPQEGDSAEAVGERVADLQHECGSAPGETVDHLDLPHGPQWVELLAGQHPADVEHIAQRTRAGRLDPPEVERQIGMGVHPQRPTEAERTVVHPLAETWEGSDRAGHRALQAVPIGRSVEQGDRHDRRAQDRVPLDLPEGGVRGVQTVACTKPQHGISGRGAVSSV